ncbi:MAG: GYD domain-containing protein [Actinomycetota bacterium]
MPRYLLRVSYTADGLKGVLKEGGSARRDAARQVVESVGGTMDSFYFAWGDTDAYLVANMPDAESAAAAAMTVSASGAAMCSTTVLIEPEEMDRAVQKHAEYRPPGT